MPKGLLRCPLEISRKASQKPWTTACEVGSCIGTPRHLDARTLRSSLSASSRKTCRHRFLFAASNGLFARMQQKSSP